MRWLAIERASGNPAGSDRLTVEGKLDPLAGADLVWWRVAMELGYPEELQDLVHGAVNGEDRREGWGIPPELTKGEIVEAAHAFVAHGADGVAHATSD